MARIRKVRISDASASGVFVSPEADEEHPPGEQTGYRPTLVPELQLDGRAYASQGTPAERYAAKYGANWATRHFLDKRRD